MRKTIATLAGLTAVALSVTGFTFDPSPTAAPVLVSADPAYYSLRLPLGLSVADLTRLGFDVGHGHGSRPVLVATPAEADRLRSLGITLGKIGEVYQPIPAGRSASAADGTTFYGGYHTPLGHEQHNAAVAKAFPNLVSLLDIGDSWKKTNGTGGHDIQALCITKKQAGDCALNTTGKKPKFILHAQIHARELSTGELAYRWIDHLVNSYGKDAEVTALVDSRELWVVPMANPDGVDIVASNPSKPILQRKNANNTSDCGLGSTGVDLNRNSSFQWDVNEGGPCDETNPGSGPASEPETLAIQGLVNRITRDTKGGVDDPATAETNAVFISLHSYGNDILAPWGYTNDAAPNRAALVALGKKMAVSNGYPVTTGDGGVGYFAPGATDDWAYGTRGLPAYTFEVGPGSGSCAGFLPSYTCMDSTFWPKNKGAFMYAAKAAAKPYGTLPR